MLSAVEIESLERATLQAVAPEVVESLEGWLLPMDHGTVGRARSAVPLHHGAHDAALLDTIVERYAARGFEPQLRLPEEPAFERWTRVLRQRGWWSFQPTLTLTGEVGRMCSVHPGPAGTLEPIPDAAWMAMFLGPGLDPSDGASRAQSLRRATGTLYASVREHGLTVACGAASFGHGWLGVHGMRTAAAQRGRGLAGQVLHTMALEARARGIERVFLQVDAANLAAQALYRRAGMQLAWRYAYWRPPGV